jgi:N-acyl-D-aspartate/D-glutamate deacylase
MLDNVKTDHIKERLLKELPPLKADALKIAQAPGADYLVGRSLGDYAGDHDLPLPKALLQLMEVTKLRALIFHKNINGDLVKRGLLRDSALVASNGASVGEEQKIIKHERFTNTFPKFLEIVDREKLLPIEVAVQKLTALPAEKYGIKNRGFIKERYVADLVLLKNNRPEYVLVNGQIAVSEGKPTNVLAGKIIKR